MSNSNDSTEISSSNPANAPGPSIPVALTSNENPKNGPRNNNSLTALLHENQSNDTLTTEEYQHVTLYEDNTAIINVQQEENPVIIQTDINVAQVAIASRIITNEILDCADQHFQTQRLNGLSQDGSPLAVGNHQRNISRSRSVDQLTSITDAHQSGVNTNSVVEIRISPSPVGPRVIQGPPPLSGAPPSYSAVMRLGPVEQTLPCRIQRPVRIQPSAPFIAPIPPPSYAEVEGYHVERPFILSGDQMAWGPDPLSVICPRCANVVITSTVSRRSNLTHISALALCLCGCWPCCILPYCMNSCKNTYHHCPTCQQFLGMYRPW